MTPPRLSPSPSDLRYQDSDSDAWTTLDELSRLKRLYENKRTLILEMYVINAGLGRSANTRLNIGECILKAQEYLAALNGTTVARLMERLERQVGSKFGGTA